MIILTIAWFEIILSLHCIKMSDLCFREMAVSAAEKQRQYRARRDANPERRAAYLRKHRQRWHESKDEGKVKMVKDLSEREGHNVNAEREQN